MSDFASSSTPRLFRPVTLLVGFILGLIMLAWAGRKVTTSNYHTEFVRFHPLIAPETMYQPTIAEMCAIVRAKCKPNQILVIVGGNSIFQGVGQPVEKLWTNHLQELLGEQYAVVNLAFRGSSPTDGGALVAESLRDEFPRQIYLANVLPFTAADAAGNLGYRFMFFDAYYKSWLIDTPTRREVVKDYLSRPDLYNEGREMALGARLDRAFRFRDFWNWWSATRFFTFPTPLTPESHRAFRARNAFPDSEPDFEAMPFLDRFSSKFAQAEMEITRNTSAIFYDRQADGSWRPVAAPRTNFINYASTAFPEPLKARTLIVISQNSPFYTQKLTPVELERNDLAFRDTIAEWEKLGYQATDYGPGLTEQDFGDRTHLTAQGGRKLATNLAPEIRALSSKLGYLKN